MRQINRNRLHFSKLAKLSCIFITIYVAVWVTATSKEVRNKIGESNLIAMKKSIRNHEDGNEYSSSSKRMNTDLKTKHDSTVITVPVKPMKFITTKLENSIILQRHERSPLENCSPTAQIRIHMLNDRWILQTLDESGLEKHIGGDEFYITYTDALGNNIDDAKDAEEVPPTSVAIIEDRKDGTYILKFSTTPMNPNPTNLVGTGRLAIYYEYTCDIGMMPQPTKVNWKNSGAILETLYQNDVQMPPMNIFQKPTFDDLSHWPLVVFFGDSTMLQMIKDREATEKAEAEDIIFLKNNTFFEANIRTEFRMDRINKIQKKFQIMHRKQMLQYEFDVAIVIGSAIWDVLIAENIQGRDFKDHLAACRAFVTDLKKKYRGRKIYWKSPSSLHAHRVNCVDANYDFQDCVDSTRYLSNSIVRFLHENQKTLMKELNVPYLDLFDTYYLSAHYTAEGDGRHYQQGLNELILDWFYPNNDE
jgi:hypothetical protein